MSLNHRSAAANQKRKTPVRYAAAPSLARKSARAEEVAAKIRRRAARKRVDPSAPRKSANSEAVHEDASIDAAPARPGWQIAVRSVIEKVSIVALLVCLIPIWIPCCLLASGGDSE